MWMSYLAMLGLVMLGINALDPQGLVYLASLGVRGESLKGHLDLLVLSVLTDGPLHGYAIIEALRERSEDAFDLPEGTVYPVLHRLERSGLLASDWDTASGRRRRTYRLTRPG